MPAEQFIAEDGSVRWYIYGDGLYANISDSMYQSIQNRATEIRRASARKQIEPLFTGEWYHGFGGVNIIRKPWSLGEPYPTETPWLMVDGRHAGAQRPPLPHPRRAIATAAILAHHIGAPHHG